LAQLSRRLLPRPAVKALLGLDRSQMLGLIGSKSVLEEARRQGEAGLCDNHLHSGAADELGDLLVRLAPRVVDGGEPRKLADAVGPRKGSRLNAAPLILAVVAACALLHPSFQPGSAVEFADDAWWRRAKRAAEEGPEIDESEFAALRAPIRELSGGLGFTPQLCDLYDALAAVAHGAPMQSEKQEACRRGLVALVALYGLISVPLDSRLGTFVSRFRLMRHVRDLFGEDSGRLASAIRTMYLEDGVSAVELRKSIIAPSSRTVSVPRIRSAIERDIKEHAQAALHACENTGNENLVVRMPLTFTRREAEPVDLPVEANDYVPFRAPVGETLAVADAIVQAVETEPERRLVGAVDLVGNEKMVPNWLYAIAYQRIARATEELEFACHAGEYFADQTEGLRRIAEVALFSPVRVRRIGHCLALGIDNGVEAKSGNEETAGLLESVTWSLLALEGSNRLQLGVSAPNPPKDLVAALKIAMQRLADEVFGQGICSVPGICNWYLSRFDSTAMGRWLPDLLQVGPTEATSWPRGVSRSRIPTPTDVADAMLAVSVYKTSFDVPLAGSTRRVQYRPASVIPADLRQQVPGLLREASAYTRESVRAWLASNEIVIESCPSSNAALSSVSITQHPIWKFHQHDLLCSVNTDDPALFGASLREEYAHVGMVAHAHGEDGAEFVAAMAKTSRNAGMIQKPLCGPGEKSISAYRALAG
jgi:hypothetical protein